MIDYRPFRNTDPPAIAEVWRGGAALRGMVQPMTPSLLEATVLSKPYFDRHGLLVAVDDHRLVGFVHAGFGPRADGASLDPTRAAICSLMVAPHQQQAAIEGELLARGEQYLQARGARVVYGRTVLPLCPFYLGLYGGCAVPGVLAGDQRMLEILARHGYVERCRQLVLHRQLGGFRPVVNRQQLQIRRSHEVQQIPDPPPASWWEACTVGSADRAQFQLRPSGSSVICAGATFWDMEPLASSWGIHARGLSHLEIAADEHRGALALFLLGEAMRRMATEGTTLVEVQIPSDDQLLAPVLQKLGFQQVDQGIGLQKTLA